MQLKKICFSLISALLLCFTLISESFANELIISNSAAELEAKIFAETGEYSEEWKNNNIIFENLVYDVDDTLLGYHFKVYEGDLYLGYIVVSASKEMNAIFSYGTSTLYTNDLEIGADEKLYIINPVTFTTAKNASELKGKFEKAKLNTIDKISKEIKEQSKLSKRELKSLEDELKILKKVELKTVKQRLQENEEIDDALLPPLNEEPNTEDLPEVGEIEESSFNEEVTQDFSILATNPLVVRRVWQRTPGVNSPKASCGPAVGVMLANYYRGRGYESINNSSYYGGDARFINHLASSSFMNTGSLGTTTGNFEFGLRKHLNLNLNSNKFAVSQISASSRYTTYKNLINGGHPVGIRFTNIKTALFGSTAYAWHYVLGTGYSGDYVRFLDPDGGETNTKTRLFIYTTYQSDMTLLWVTP